MALRLEPKDEYMHELGPEPNFNESMYFNLFDPSQRIGGFWRLGNRANEGQAEMTVCLYLPDGRVAFMFGRPPITSNDAFDAGGLRIEVMRPFEELHVSYRGRVVLLERPLEMADPKAAFTQNPHEDCQVAVTFTNVSTPFGGEPEEAREPTGEEFARGHYEQLIAGEGTIAVGGQSWEVRGYGPWAVEERATPGDIEVKIITAVHAYWQAVGVDSEAVPIPLQRHEAGRRNDDGLGTLAGYGSKGKTTWGKSVEEMK